MYEKKKVIGKIIKAEFSRCELTGEFAFELDFILETGPKRRWWMPVNKCRGFISQLGASRERDLVGKLCWLTERNPLNHINPEPIWKEKMSVKLGDFLRNSGKEELMEKIVNDL